MSTYTPPVHRPALAAAVLLGVLLLAAPAWAGGTPSLPGSSGAGIGVDLQGVRFVPSDITVRVGDTVTWVHRDSALSHHVGAHDGSFDSHPTCGHLFGVCMKGGETFSFTFRQTGSYVYHCRPHARHHHGSAHGGMVGTVTVVD
jgi:plastocyanin